MKILVTGDRGYIGSVLTKMLLNKSHEVVGYDTEDTSKQLPAVAQIDFPDQ